MYQQARAIVQAEIDPMLTTASWGAFDAHAWLVPIGLPEVLDGTFDPRSGPPEVLPQQVPLVDRQTGANLGEPG